MPYALIKRNTGFSLIIIDTDDGGIVFESSDASNPWDGIDKRNGQLVNKNKTFIWKVTLTSPEKMRNLFIKGQSFEYKSVFYF